jgi:hypothetical protein
VDPDSTGLNPAWRKAIAQLGYGTGWGEGTSTAEITQLRKQLAQNLKKVSDLTPGSGAYFNEVGVFNSAAHTLDADALFQASMFEPNPSYTFFGSHYDKLKAIKNIYDPVGLFIVRDGVGSDDWDESLNCLR